MKRTLSLSLALMMLLLSVSCGDTSSNGGNDTTASGGSEQNTASDTEAPKSLLDDLGEKDFEGRTFTFLDSNGNPAAHVNIPGDSENGDIINDSLYERDIYIEDRYNVKIDYIETNDSNLGCANVKNSVLAGDSEYDFIMSRAMGGCLDSLATDGSLANLCDIPYLSLTENWWSHYMYDNLRIDNKMYFTTGDITPTMYQMPACVYINRDLAEDYQVDTDFASLVLDGKWTFDALNQVVADKDDDLNNDDVYNENDDFFGFAVQMHGLMTQSLLCGAGVNLSSVTDDGSNIVIDFSGDRTANVVEKIRQLIPQHIVYGGSGVNVSKIFTENRSIAMMHFVESSMNSLRDMKSDYYILPVPKYDESQKDYRSVVNPWINAFAAIPLNADPEFSGFITEAMARYSYENIRPKAYDITYKVKMTRDEHGAEMLDVIFNNVYLDFNCIYDFGTTRSKLDSIIIHNDPLTSTIAAVQSKADSEIAKFISNWDAE